MKSYPNVTLRIDTRQRLVTLYKSFDNDYDVNYICNKCKKVNVNWVHFWKTFVEKYVLPHHQRVPNALTSDFLFSLTLFYNFLL